MQIENNSDTIIVNLPFKAHNINPSGSNIAQIISHLEVENHILPLPHTKLENINLERQEKAVLLYKKKK